jgi:hypothetical protein
MVLEMRLCLPDTVYGFMYLQFLRTHVNKSVDSYTKIFPDD